MGLGAYPTPQPSGASYFGGSEERCTRHVDYILVADGYCRNRAPDHCRSKIPIRCTGDSRTATTADDRVRAGSMECNYLKSLFPFLAHTNLASKSPLAPLLQRGGQASARAPTNSQNITSRCSRSSNGGTGPSPHTDKQPKHRIRMLKIMKHALRFR